MAYQQFITDQASNSHDYWQQYVSNFLVMGCEFRMFWQSVRNGDRLKQEESISKFLGIFLLLSKHNYVNICLDGMDREYSQISYQHLQQIRLNSACHYNCGKDCNGQVYHCVALDEMQENITQERLPH